MNHEETLSKISNLLWQNIPGIPEAVLIKNNGEILDLATQELEYYHKVIKIVEYKKLNDHGYTALLILVLGKIKAVKQRTKFNSESDPELKERLDKAIMLWLVNKYDTVLSKCN